MQAINKARVATRILFITAHPDDETAGLLAYLSRGLDADVALLTLTRGQGGQNAVGPEQDGAAGRDSHDGIAGGGQPIRRASIFHARAWTPDFRKAPSAR